MTISKDQIKAIMPNVTAENLERFTGPLNDALVKWAINTPRRIGMFMAQLAHESGSLKYTLELADGRAYEGRGDLGNTQPGDGPKFRGRGLIQITGRANYEAYFIASGLPKDSDPKLLEGPVYATDSAAWFWKTKGLNEIADKPETWRHDYKGKAWDPFHWVSVRINGINKTTGMPNGMVDRLKYYKNAKLALNII